MRPPRDPEGPTERVAWSKHLIAWIHWISVKEIVGFTKKESSTGITFTPKNMSSDEESNSNTIPRWG